MPVELDIIEGMKGLEVSPLESAALSSTVPTPPQNGDEDEPVEKRARRIARREGVNPQLVLALISKESSGDRNAKSWKGYKGYMQISEDKVPKFYKENPKAGVYDPEANITTGTRYLKSLLNKYSKFKDGERRALAAYNAGEKEALLRDDWERYAEMWSNDPEVQAGKKPRGKSDPTNTLAYVNRIYQNYKGGKSFTEALYPIDLGIIKNIAKTTDIKKSAPDKDVLSTISVDTEQKAVTPTVETIQPQSADQNSQLEEFEKYRTAGGQDDFDTWKKNNLPKLPPKVVDEEVPSVAEEETPVVKQKQQFKFTNEKTGQEFEVDPDRTGLKENQQRLIPVPKVVKTEEEKKQLVTETKVVERDKDGKFYYLDKNEYKPVEKKLTTVPVKAKRIKRDAVKQPSSVTGKTPVDELKETGKTQLGDTTLTKVGEDENGVLTVEDETGETYKVDTENGTIDDDSLKQVADTLEFRRIPLGAKPYTPLEAAQEQVRVQLAEQIKSKYGVARQDFINWSKVRGFRDIKTDQPVTEENFYTSPQRGLGTLGSETNTYSISRREMSELKEFARQESARREQLVLDMLARGQTPDQATLDALEIDLPKLSRDRFQDYDTAFRQGAVAREDFETFKRQNFLRGMDDYESSLEAGTRLGWYSRQFADKELGNYRAERQRVMAKVDFEYRGFKDPSAWTREKQEQLGNLQSKIADYGTITNLVETRKRLQDIEESRKASLEQRMNQLWGEGRLPSLSYLEEASKNTVFNFGRGFYGFLVSDGIKGAVAWTKPIADFTSYLFGVEGTQNLAVRDNVVYQATETLDGFIDGAFKPDTNELFAQTEGAGRFLTTVLPQGVSTSAAMLFPSLSKFPRIAIGLYSMTGMTGNAYDEAIKAGADEVDAQRYALANGLLGWTEVFGIGNALVRLNQGTGGTIWRRFFREALEAASKEVPEEVIQEGIQTTTGNMLARLTYDPNREIDRGLGEALLAAGISANLISTAVTALNTVRYGRAIKEVLKQDRINGLETVRNFGDGVVYVYGKKINVTDELKPLVAKHSVYASKIAQGYAEVENIVKQAETLPVEQRGAIRQQVKTLSEALAKDAAAQRAVAEELAQKSGVSKPEPEEVAPEEAERIKVEVVGEQIIQPINKPDVTQEEPQSESYEDNLLRALKPGIVESLNDNEKKMLSVFKRGERLSTDEMQKRAGLEFNDFIFTISSLRDKDLFDSEGESDDGTFVRFIPESAFREEAEPIFKGKLPADAVPVEPTAPTEASPEVKPETVEQTSVDTETVSEPELKYTSPDDYARKSEEEAAKYRVDDDIEFTKDDGTVVKGRVTQIRNGRLLGYKYKKNGELGKASFDVTPFRTPTTKVQNEVEAPRGIADITNFNLEQLIEEREDYFQLSPEEQEKYRQARDIELDEEEGLDMESYFENLQYEASDYRANEPASENGRDYFSAESIKQAENQTDKSREILVDLPVDVFINLAMPLREGADSKTERIQKAIEDGVKFDQLPYLRITHNGDKAQVNEHDGRHRAMELQRRGVKTIPVVLISDKIRWGSQEAGNLDRVPDGEFPTVLVSQDGEFEIPFPVTREQADDQNSKPDKKRPTLYEGDEITLKDGTKAEVVSATGDRVEINVFDAQGVPVEQKNVPYASIKTETNKLFNSLTSPYDSLEDEEVHRMLITDLTLPLEQAPAAGFESTRVSSTGVIREMQKVLEVLGNTIIRSGRVGNVQAQGLYKPRVEVIRLAQANNIVAAAHEVGHAIQKAVFGGVNAASLNPLPPVVIRELIELGRDLYGARNPAGGYRSEGFAEFVRLWLTGETTAVDVTSTIDWFNDTFLSDHEDLAEAMHNARNKVQEYINQGAVNRAEANVQKGLTVKERIRRIIDFFRKMPTEFVDEFTPLLRLSRNVERISGTVPAPADDPYSVASVLRGSAPARVQYMAYEGMVDAAGNKVGRPLIDATSMMRGKEGEFVRYLWAMRTLELAAQDKNSGMTVEDARYIRDEYEQRPDGFKFIQAAQYVYDWNHGVLNYIRQMVPELDETVERILLNSQLYVPLMRAFDDVEPDRLAGRYNGFAGNALKRLKGSNRRIKNVFPQMLANAERLIQMAHKRKVLDTIANLERVDGIGSILEEVPRNMVPTTLTLDMIRQSLDAAGVDTDAIDLDEAATFFTPAQYPSGKEPIVPIVRGGAVRWYRVPAELYNTLSGLDLYTQGWLAHFFLGVPTRAFRLGTTGLRPSFSLLTNPLRDISTLAQQTQSRNPARLALEYFKALGSAINPKRVVGENTEALDLLHRLGVNMSQPLGVDEAITTKAGKKLFQHPVRRIVTQPVNMLREIFSTPEMIPREAEVRALAKQIGYTIGTTMDFNTMVQLSLAGKRATVDFSAMGRIGKVLNQSIPFFNASVQGSRSFLRSLKNRPTYSVLTGLVTMTLPTLLLWFKYKDEEWWKQMPVREKFMYWHFRVGEKITQIPRTQDWGGFFASLPEAIFNSWYERDKEGFMKSVGYLFDTVTPDVSPVLFKLGKEQWSNQIEFFERPIVPKSEESRPPQEQASPYTSVIAKWLGANLPEWKLAGVPLNSPRRLDAAARTLMGGLGGDLMHILDVGKRDFTISDYPVIGRLFRQGGVEGVGSRSVEQFYDALEKAKTRQASVQNPETDLEKQDRQFLEEVSKSIAVVRRLAMEETTVEGRERYSRLITALSELAVKKSIDYSTEQYSKLRPEDVDLIKATESKLAEVEQVKGALESGRKEDIKELPKREQREVLNEALLSEKQQKFAQLSDTEKLFKFRVSTLEDKAETAAFIERAITNLERKRDKTPQEVSLLRELERSVDNFEDEIDSRPASEKETLREAAKNAEKVVIPDGQRRRKRVSKRRTGRSQRNDPLKQLLKQYDKR